MGGDMQERISVRAYKIWEEKGRPSGSAEDHWHQAKREIEQEDRAAGGVTAKKPKATGTGKPAAAAKSADATATRPAAKPAAERKPAAKGKPASKKKN